MTTNLGVVSADQVHLEILDSNPYEEKDFSGSNIDLLAMVILKSIT